MKPVLKVQFFIENDKMTDEEYQNQDEKEFIITESMIRDIVEQNVELGKGNRLCENNFYINKI
jgi:hypothetical protein